MRKTSRVIGGLCVPILPRSHEREKKKRRYDDSSNLRDELFYCNPGGWGEEKGTNIGENDNLYARVYKIRLENYVNDGRFGRMKK